MAWTEVKAYIVDEFKYNQTIYLSFLKYTIDKAILISCD